MASELETKLACLLALAVGHEAQKSLDQGIVGYQFPDWYVDALDALMAYRDEQEQKVTY